MKLSRHLLVSLLAVAALSGCGTNSSPTGANPSLDTTPPPAPTNVIVSRDATTGRMQLSWDASTAADLAGYEVWQAPVGTADFALAGSIDGDSPNYSVPLVDQSATVDYRVRAYDLTGNHSPFSGSTTAQLVPVRNTEPGGPAMGRVAP